MSNEMMSLAVVVVAALAILFLWNRLVHSSRNRTGNMENASVNNVIERLTPADYQSRYAKPKREHLLLDVRSPEEFREGRIPGAVNIELDSLIGRLAEIPQDKPVILYCRSGRRSEMAAQILAQSGYRDIANLGGIIDWQRQGLPVR
jgi:phage shock protein E